MISLIAAVAEARSCTAIGCGQPNSCGLACAGRGQTNSALDLPLAAVLTVIASRRRSRKWLRAPGGGFQTPWAPVLRDADEQARLCVLTGQQLQLSPLAHLVGSLRRSGSSRPLALQFQVLALKPALGASQLGVGCLRAGGSSLDIDTPAEHKASNRDPGCTGRSRPFVVVVEAADDSQSRLYEPRRLRAPRW